MENVLMRKVISIGSSCRPRYQIDKFLKSVNPNYKPTSYYFDWLMMGGLNGVVNMLNRDFSVQEDDIYIFEEKGRFIPRDRESGFAFLHDFGMKNKWADSREECAASIEASLQDSLRKYAYLGEKTKGALCSGEGAYLVYHGAETKENFARLNLTLSQKCRGTFTVINVLEYGTPPSVTDGSVINIFVDDKSSPKKGTAREWEGWDETWHSAFSSVLLLRNSAQMEFCRDQAKGSIV